MDDKIIKIEPEDDNNAEKQQQKEPPRKVTKSIQGGQLMEYNFLESVNSVEELNNFRFKVFNQKKHKKLALFLYRIAADANHALFSNHIPCHAQEKRDSNWKNNAILNCWQCVSRRVAPSMSMPMESIIIQSSQKVRVVFLNNWYWGHMKLILTMAKN
jgi:hypothetical protein